MPKKSTATKITLTFKKGTDHHQRRIITSFVRKLANYETKKAKRLGKVDENAPMLSGEFHWTE